MVQRCCRAGHASVAVHSRPLDSGRVDVTVVVKSPRRPRPEIAASRPARSTLWSTTPKCSSGEVQVCLRVRVRQRSGHPHFHVHAHLRLHTQSRQRDQCTAGRDREGSNSYGEYRLQDRVRDGSDRSGLPDLDPVRRSPLVALTPSSSSWPPHGPGRGCQPGTTSAAVPAYWC